MELNKRRRNWKGSLTEPMFENHPILIPCLIALWTISIILISLVFWQEIRLRGVYKASDLWTHLVMLPLAPIALVLLLGYLAFDKWGDKVIWESSEHRLIREHQLERSEPAIFG